MHSADMRAIEKGKPGQKEREWWWQNAVWDRVLRKDCLTNVTLKQNLGRIRQVSICNVKRKIILEKVSKGTKHGEHDGTEHHSNQIEVTQVASSLLKMWIHTSDCNGTAEKCASADPTGFLSHLTLLESKPTVQLALCASLGTDYGYLSLALPLPQRKGSFSHGSKEAERTKPEPLFCPEESSRNTSLAQFPVGAVVALSWILPLISLQCLLLVQWLWWLLGHRYHASVAYTAQGHH